jgi:hypothetical protein
VIRTIWRNHGQVSFIKSKSQRCERRFRNKGALEEHLAHSNSHHRCNACSYDGTTWQALVDHSKATGHSSFCQGCNNGSGKLWQPNSQDYHDHFEEENGCSICLKHFETWKQVAAHCRRSGHAKVCNGCCEGNGAIWRGRDKEFTQHLEEESVCDVCEKHCHNLHNLTLVCPCTAILNLCAFTDMDELIAPKDTLDST